jgi:molybdopterin/thiamine biosynthesis adenylyltransferase
MASDFLRYSCQIALPGFNETAQLRLQQAKVLIVGAGGLGCPAALYLASAGVGTLSIVDFDSVSISNLHRQILYTPSDVGLKKAIVAADKLQQQNPGIKVTGYDIKIISTNVLEILGQYDIVVDGTDNFDTRYLLNDACVLTGKPIVYGAIYQFEGQLAVWNVSNDDGSRGPNYRDLFPQVDATQIPNCADGGVIPTLAGIIGCMQANEVIKYITKTGDLLAGKVMVFDALINPNIRTCRYPHRPGAG